MIDQDLEANQIYIGTRLNHVVKENRAPNNIWNKDPARSVGGTNWLIGD